MKHLTESLSLIFTRKDSRLVIILSTLALLFILLAAQNGKSSLAVLGFAALPLLDRITLTLSTFFDFTSTFTAGTLLVALLGSLLGGINLSLAYTYMKLRGEVIVKSGLYSGVGLIIAFIGIGCAACGTALLSVVLGMFGFSAMLNIFPYQGQELGYIGLIILILAAYFLSKKVAAPTVC